MKKLVLIYWLCIASASAYSQSVELKVNNPMPRVGDNLYVSFEINPEKTELQKGIVNITAKEKKSASPFKMCTDPDYTIGSGSLSLKKKLEKTGNLQFGPFSFNIDGKNYKSGLLNVIVYPELPKEKNGVWISYIKSGEDNYVIIEQRIEGYDEKLFGRSPSLLNNDNVFVRVVDSLTNKPNRDIVFVGGVSSLGTRYIDNDSKNKDGQFMQRTLVYKVWTSEKYKNDFMLGREQLLNLPEKSDFSPILIKVD